MKPRNHVMVAMVKRSGGGAHGKTRGAKRAAGKADLRKEIGRL